MAAKIWVINTNGKIDDTFPYEPGIILTHNRPIKINQMAIESKKKIKKRFETMRLVFSKFFLTFFLFYKNRQPNILKRSKNQRNNTCKRESQVVIRKIYQRTILLKQKFITEVYYYTEHS